MKKIVHTSIHNRNEYTCMHTRNYVQTNMFTNNRTCDRNNVEWRRKILPLCYARYARKLVAGHLFRSCRKYRIRKYRIRNFVAVIQENERSIWRRMYTYIRGRVYICSLTRNHVYQFPKDISWDWRRSVFAQDNRDKWPVIRRSLKRGHSYELPEPAVSKIDFQLRGFGIPLRLLRHPLQSLDSLWTQRGRR